jgi:hypothetical protein
MKHFADEDDFTILLEVIANPPWKAKHGDTAATWEAITRKVSVLIDRVVKYRSIKDHFEMLIGKFKKDQAVSKAASGISEVVTRKDALLMECLDLMRLSRDTEIATSPEEISVKESSLKRWREKSELGEENASESSTAETRSYSTTKRNQNAVVVNLPGEYVAVTRTTAEEKAALKKIELEIDRVKVEYEMTRFKEDLELRKKQQETALECAKTQQQTELKMREAEFELRAKQQAGQQQQSEAIATLLNLLIPMIAKSNAEKNENKKISQFNSCD